jgi:succinate dehydrogenase / fumarate reductase, membrane anchor subunit
MTLQSITPARPQENVWAWLIKIATGPLLVILILVHLVVNHFVGSQGGLMTYADVVAYFSNPLIVAMEILFLIAAVVHSLLGLRAVLLDLQPSAGTVQLINWGFALVGVVSIVYGIWLALTIAGFSS